MILPLIHHGMLWVGVPYTEAALFESRTGGSPYGASHVAAEWNIEISKHEETIARALGRRVAELALRLQR
jgi:NAD(P)H dehydrogenase (quinone)